MPWCRTGYNFRYPSEWATRGKNKWRPITVAYTFTTLSAKRKNVIIVPYLYASDTLHKLPPVDVICVFSIPQIERWTSLIATGN